MDVQTVSFFLVLFTIEVFGSYSSHYQGPLANPTVLQSGYLADTHEVAAAKSAHLAARAKDIHSYAGDYGYGHGESYGHLRYQGPTAIPHVLHDGHIADTHEVAAAKAAHYTAVAKVKLHPSPNSYGGSYGYGDHEIHNDQGNFRYHGPIAIPHVLHDGHIADTHEVAAAKAEHFAAVAKAKTHAGYGHDLTESHAGEYALTSRAHHGPYHGPLASPVVLPSGYLADTHEVVAAKKHHFSALRASGKPFSNHEETFH